MPTYDNTPTELTIEDIHKALEALKNYTMIRRCWGCSKEFLPNYSGEECDQCYFDKFPKDQVTAYYKSIIKDILG